MEHIIVKLLLGAVAMLGLAGLAPAREISVVAKQSPIISQINVNAVFRNIPKQKPPEAEALLGIVPQAEAATETRPAVFSYEKDGAHEIVIDTAWSKDDVRSFIESESKKKGINPKLALWIVEKESQFESTRLGDDGNSRGLWQVSKIWHPEVSDKCALDVKCSTEWSLKRILNGYVREWSTIRFCRKWFMDCPF